MERLAYLIKHWSPGPFPVIEGFARLLSGLRFGCPRARPMQSVVHRSVFSRARYNRGVITEPIPRERTRRERVLQDAVAAGGKGA